MNRTTKQGHFFEQVCAAEGRAYSDERCKNCGMDAKKYRSNMRQFLVNGKWQAFQPLCGSVGIIPKRNKPVLRPSLLPLTELEARLKDAYVILNALYEDAVSAGIRTRGRMMAGRFLYSTGYAETVKKLEQQYS